MRTSFFPRCIPRGAHPPTAKFLHHRTSGNTLSPHQGWSNASSFAYSFSVPPTTTRKTENNSTSNPLIDQISTRKQDSVPKIPSRCKSTNNQDPAPLSSSKPTSPTDEFRTILRSNTTKKKITKTSPKNYYTCAHKTSSKESKNISVFTRFSKLL